MAKKEKSFVEMIEDKYGEDIIEQDIPEGDVVSISTGSLSLDISTGVGGIPLEKITEIFGPESSAKTTLCLEITKRAILKGYKVLYVDQENTLDHNYIRAIIGEFNTSMLVLSQPETAEQALYICEAGIKSGDFNVVILDSIGALAPEKEKEDDFGKAHVAQVPRLLSAFLRRNAYTIRHNNVAFIFVNQVRANIGSYTGGFQTPGGYAVKHYASLRIQLYKAEAIEQGDVPVGSYSRYSIKKNKMAPPFRGGTFPLLYGIGIDSIRDTIEFAEMLGILEKRGSYYTYEGETVAQGMVKTIEFLKNNPETLDKIIERVYNVTTTPNMDLAMYHIWEKEEEVGEPRENA